MGREWPEGSAGGGREGFFVWAFFVGGAGLFVALVLLAPLLQGAQYRFSAAVLYRGFSYVCHQRPERSFYLAGHPLAVCARCWGLYAGCAAGALIYPWLRSLRGRRATAFPSRLWFMLALIPMGLDFGLDFLGLWANTHFSRAATGVLLGAVAPFYLLPGLLDLARPGARGRIFSAAAAAGDDGRARRSDLA